MAYGQRDNDGPLGWRSRYKRPDGTLGSKSGFSSEKAAEEWGNEQEALIRRNMWIDPRDAETRFEDFVNEWMDAISPRLALGTTTKYRSHLKTHLIPQWADWPVIGIFNGYIEIEKWVSELHEDLAETTVASIFATFSTIMNAVKRAHMIPANPCHGVRVTAGEYEIERLVASPVQGLRGAMRLYESGLGLSGFVLCLVDLYTGGRWGELAGQRRHNYDTSHRGLHIRTPLVEIGGKLYLGGKDLENMSAAELAQQRSSPRSKANKKGRTKTPTGTRLVELPPSIATFYELLLDSHPGVFTFLSPEGAPWRRSNFRQRFWRPAWDGVDVDFPTSPDHLPSILQWFTFHEGRHTQSTWLIEDGIPEVARRARLGQKMKGIGRIYDHVTPEMRARILEVLESRWQASLEELTVAERTKLNSWFPHLGPPVAMGRSTEAPSPFHRHLITQT